MAYYFFNPHPHSEKKAALKKQLNSWNHRAFLGGHFTLSSGSRLYTYLNGNDNCNLERFHALKHFLHLVFFSPLFLKWLHVFLELFTI